ncbi:DUF1985 domain-containing protein [Abeliophyllum distichum]|uniref:DUF1985 domain-containing protein n=1 Tax=Abeliophyllum distichum TaxID=126358 RepID=A0ABD1TYZ2_9LAMI
MRSTKTSKKEEAWFRIGNKRARFGLQEFVLVTGLNACGFEDVYKSVGAHCLIVKDHFKKSGENIMKGDVYEAFKRCKRNKIDKYKLGLIIVLAYVLLATEENTLIDMWWFKMIWAFEAIPSLGKKFAKKYANGILRMLAWKMPKRLTSSAVDNVLESKELEVKSTSISTEAECGEVYWQELTPCVEEEDTASQDSKENETEHDAKPSHSFHQHYS